ncbi:MarR family winged helix-turn-helix transcriptional regulator [Segnochrobactrum spirostomi]|uniref:MarR family transcriptional regulator n=1 Tax=Segnochrobactrum spirostomi TaxID=2608987 RepID=A0A6A7YAD6_9HYPH|nr:MarR family transcriptional regulator [Segnochrobactrum spirostomi]MQT14622.1 MarR family transcriptional regulator [Segnochrobactrum spirostomi]
MSERSDIDLVRLLSEINALLRSETERRARAHGTSRAQWAILYWLERAPGLSQKEVASRLEIEPISVARLIDRLEAAGLVERRPDPADRRVWRLHLRAAAGPVLARLNEEKGALNALLADGLDGAMRDQLLDALRALKANLSRERSGDAAA